MASLAVQPSTSSHHGYAAASRPSLHPTAPRSSVFASRQHCQQPAAAALVHPVLPSAGSADLLGASDTGSDPAESCAFAAAEAAAAAALQPAPASRAAAKAAAAATPPSARVVPFAAASQQAPLGKSPPPAGGHGGASPGPGNKRKRTSRPATPEVGESAGDEEQPGSAKRGGTPRAAAAVWRNGGVKPELGGDMYDAVGACMRQQLAAMDANEQALLQSCDGEEECDDMGDEEEDPEKAKERREKNRIAARKCRAKKVAMLRHMQEELKELVSQNQEMKMQVVTWHRMFSREVKLREAMKRVILAIWTNHTVCCTGYTANDVIIGLEAGTLDVNGISALLQHSGATGAAAAAAAAAVASAAAGAAPPSGALGSDGLPAPPDPAATGAGASHMPPLPPLRLPPPPPSACPPGPPLDSAGMPLSPAAATAAAAAHQLPAALLSSTASPYLPPAQSSFSGLTQLDSGFSPPAGATLGAPPPLYGVQPAPAPPASPVSTVRRKSGSAFSPYAHSGPLPAQPSPLPAQPSPSPGGPAVSSEAVTTATARKATAGSAFSCAMGGPPQPPPSPDPSSKAAVTAAAAAALAAEAAADAVTAAGSGSPQPAGAAGAGAGAGTAKPNTFSLEHASGSSSCSIMERLLSVTLPPMANAPSFSLDLMLSQRLPSFSLDTAPSSSLLALGDPGPFMTRHDSGSMEWLLNLPADLTGAVAAASEAAVAAAATVAARK